MAPLRVRELMQSGRLTPVLRQHALTIVVVSDVLAAAYLYAVRGWHADWVVLLLWIVPFAALVYVCTREIVAVECPVCGTKNEESRERCRRCRARNYR